MSWLTRLKRLDEFSQSHPSGTDKADKSPSVSSVSSTTKEIAKSDLLGGCPPGVGGAAAEKEAERPPLDIADPHAMFEHTLAHELARRTPRPEAERLALVSGAVAWVVHHEGDAERIEQVLARVEAGADAEGQFERLLAQQNVQRPGGSR